MRWRGRDTAVLVLAAVLTALLCGHQWLPNPAGIGTLIDSFAPWLGLGVPVLVLLALVTRTRSGIAALVPALAWAVLFGPQSVPEASGATAELRVASQNMHADNSVPRRTAADLADTGADLIGLQEMTSATRGPVTEVLEDEYPHHARTGTVELWSRYPIVDSEPVDVGLDWARALRARVRTPAGPLAVYVAHLPSLRPGSIAERDRGLAELFEALADDPASSVIVLGDLNTATTDRVMSSLPEGIRFSQRESGGGPGFTWPDAFPMTRLDHVLFRGLEAVDSEVVDTRGSDHRAVTAEFAR